MNRQKINFAAVTGGNFAIGPGPHEMCFLNCHFKDSSFDFHVGAHGLVLYACTFDDCTFNVPLPRLSELGIAAACALVVKGRHTFVDQNQTPREPRELTQADFHSA